MSHPILHLQYKNTKCSHNIKIGTGHCIVWGKKNAKKEKAAIKNSQPDSL
jgi:hypothetical protein